MRSLKLALLSGFALLVLLVCGITLVLQYYYRPDPLEEQIATGNVLVVYSESTVDSDGQILRKSWSIRDGEAVHSMYQLLRGNGTTDSVIWGGGAYASVYLIHKDNILLRKVLLLDRFTVDIEGTQYENPQFIRAAARIPELPEAQELTVEQLKALPIWRKPKGGYGTWSESAWAEKVQQRSGMSGIRECIPGDSGQSR